MTPLTNRRPRHPQSLLKYTEGRDPSVSCDGITLAEAVHRLAPMLDGPSGGLADDDAATLICPPILKSPITIAPATAGSARRQRRS